jgi:hypothetical protein
MSEKGEKTETVLKKIGEAAALVASLVAAVLSGFKLFKKK